MGRTRTHSAAITSAGGSTRWPDLVFVVTLGWLALGLVLAVANRNAAEGIEPFALVGGAGLAATSTIDWIILRRTGNPIGMADRVDSIGGTLEVRSSPGSGTSVIGRVPVCWEATS